MNPRQKSSDKFRQRQSLKRVLWVGLPVVLAVGVYYPVLGFMVVGCMLASIVVSFWKGRAWCDVCPRGTFLDVVMSKVSMDRPVPGILRSLWFRILMLAVLMTVMTVRLIQVWGDTREMGMVFLILLGLTTLVGVILAVFYKPRSWCAFCPMGSMASWIGRRKLPLKVDADKCVDCSLCAKACPMELYPGAYRSDQAMMHGDCTKCMRCINACPKDALEFDTDRAPKEEASEALEKSVT